MPRRDQMRAELREVAARYAALFKAWGATGGKTRARRLTAEERRAIAKKAARARWSDASKAERRDAARNAARARWAKAKK